MWRHWALDESASGATLVWTLFWDVCSEREEWERQRKRFLHWTVHKHNNDGLSCTLKHIKGKCMV